MKQFFLIILMMIVLACGGIEDLPLVVWMEDEPRHSYDAPFCSDESCACHTDEALFSEHIEKPVQSGALNIWDAQALLWPER